MRMATPPETILTAPNSPSERAKLSTTPYSRAQRMAGSVIRTKVCRPEAPRLRAACSCSVPISCSTGTISLMTSGRLTNAVARMIPNGA